MDLTQRILNELMESGLTKTLDTLADSANMILRNQRNDHMPKFNTYNNSFITDTTQPTVTESNQDTIILVFAPSSYIYASNGMMGYNCIKSGDNLMTKYNIAKRDTNMWQRKYDSHKKGIDSRDIKFCNHCQNRIKYINSKFENQRLEFIINLVKRILTSYNKIYIETPPDIKSDIKNNGFRNMHYMDMDYCTLALEINAYDIFIEELIEQIDAMNVCGSVFNDSYKELHVIPEKITTECHNHCYFCGNSLIGSNYINCEDQILTCPSCNRLIREYPNMLNNIQSILHRLK